MRTHTGNVNRRKSLQAMIATGLLLVTAPLPGRGGDPHPFRSAEGDTVEIREVEGGKSAGFEDATIRIHAERGIIRFTLDYPPDDPPAALAIEVTPWAEALEGLDAERPDGSWTSLKENGRARIHISNGTLRIELDGDGLQDIPSGSRLQLIDFYR